MTGYHSNLLSLPSLGSDAAGIRKLDAEVSGDLSQNEALSKQYAGTIHGGGENCNCDCSKHDPQLHVKAATMLEQVGEVRNEAFYHHLPLCMLCQLFLLV